MTLTASEVLAGDRGDAQHRLRCLTKRELAQVTHDALKTAHMRSDLVLEAWLYLYAFEESFPGALG